LAPADLQKEGSHFDLPIALALLAAMEVVPLPELENFAVMGELGLDGTLAPVAGVLAAAIAAAGQGRGLICPAAQGGEAAWSGAGVLAPASLLSLINHFKGHQRLARPTPKMQEEPGQLPDLHDVLGQESAKRALEIAASGGHHLLMSGPPGSGKSMLAARLTGLLPPLDPAEALEVSMIHSVAGTLDQGRLLRLRPLRDPHHTASAPALVGGGQRARPGEISLAHRGVLFLDELPEFPRASLEALRQPLESGRAVVARANAHVTYPARFQLIAAMNPCKCGHLADPGRGCGRAPKCGIEYRSRLSGPLLDRFDLFVDVPKIEAADLGRPRTGEASETVAARVRTARTRQAERYARLAPQSGVLTNAEADGRLLEAASAPDGEAQRLLADAAQRLGLSARGYHRVLRVARTLADMSGEAVPRRPHVAEALAYRIPLWT
jgi:magnesium chelatase family protein